MNDAGGGEDGTFRYGPGQVDVEGDGQDEHVPDQRADREEGRIVECLEVDGPVDRVGGVEEIRPDRLIGAEAYMRSSFEK